MSWIKHTVNAQVFVALGFIFLLIAAVAGAILNFVVWPTFGELERQEAQQNAERVFEALTNEIGHVDRVATDWATWDDTYDYVRGENKSYVEDNLYFDAFVNLGHNLIAIYDLSGRQIAARVFDLESGEGLSPASFTGDLPATHPFLALDNPESSVTGIVQTEYGLMLVASRPIVHSSGEGPAVGALVMGRLLTDAVIAELQEQTHLKFSIIQSGLEDLPAEDRPPGSPFKASNIRYDDTDPNVISTLQSSRLLTGDQPIAIRTETPRSVTEIGQKTLLTAACISILAGLVIMVALLLLLRRLIVRPLVGLKDHVLSVGATGMLAQRRPMSRNDEIGVLARQFDATFDQLTSLRQRLLEQSRYTGMAEMAAGVIHNLRNALSPVAVGLARLLKAGNEPITENLRRACAELCDTNTPTERRQQLLRLVNLVIEKLTQDHQDLTKELQNLIAHNEHIEQILNDHEQFSRSERRLEPVNLATIIAESAKLLAGSWSVPVEIAVNPSVGQAPPVMADAVVLKQILGNLFVNAAEAIQAAGSPIGRIEVGAITEFRDRREIVQIQVCDNGQGIDSDTLRKIFDRGFSTKRSKTGGIGLHWCTNSLASMAGTMFAESEGPGRGATFNLVLPAAA